MFQNGQKIPNRKKCNGSYLFFHLSCPLAIAGILESIWKEDSNEPSFLQTVIQKLLAKLMDLCEKIFLKHNNAVKSPNFLVRKQGLKLQKGTVYPICFS